MTKIDITKPLEAVSKKTGKVVPVTFDRMASSGGNYFYTQECPNGDETNSVWYLNGNDYCALNVWFIRNKADSFTVGQTVYFRDGTEGIYLGPLKDTTRSTVYAVKRGLYEFIPLAAYRNGMQYSGGDLESPDDFAASPEAFKPKVTYTFRNVYQDGTAGSTAHNKLETAKMAAKVGKTRIGILKIGTDGSTELLKCLPAARVSGYEPATWTDA